MKNLYSKNEFLTLHKEGEMINEGFIGKIFKGLWGSVMKLANKIKGSKEINEIYDKYKKEIDTAFAKFGNISSAETTSAATTVKKVVDNYNVFEAEEATTVAEETPEQKQQNTEEQKKLVNLTPEKLAEISKLTQARIGELKKQFETEINGVVSRLSKKPEYSSDKLTKLATVLKNQFNTYVYNQWYGVYQKAGDKDKLVELATAKKQSEAEFKKSLDELNTAIGEKQKQLEIATDKEFMYHNSEGKDIKVKVIGKGLGINQDNKQTQKPEHKNMWKVQSVPKDGTEGEMFWVAPSLFKQLKVKKTP